MRERGQGATNCRECKAYEDRSKLMRTQSHGGIEAVDTIHTAAASNVDVVARLAHRAIARSAHTLRAATQSLAASSPTLRELPDPARNTIETSMRETPLRIIAVTALAGRLLARVAGR